MAAPKGNQFWKMRTKHGVDKLFTEFKTLWEAACEYFQWCTENPIIEKDWVGKEGNEIEREHPRAFTMQGLCLYLGVNTVYFNQFESRMESLSDEQKEGFAQVIKAIRETCYNQKFTYAAVNLMNANLISRDLGMVDRKDITTKDKALPNQMIVATPEQMREIGKALDDEV